MINLIYIINEIKWKRINGEAESQRKDNTTKIYDSYIYLIEFNTNVKNNLKYLSIRWQNKIVKTQSLIISA